MSDKANEPGQAHAEGKSRIYQAARDQYIIEGGPPRPRPRRVAVLTAVTVITAVAVLVPWLTESPGTHARTALPPLKVPVENGLLTSADLAGLDLKLSQTDLQPHAPGTTACGKGAVHPTDDLARQFSDSPNIFLTEIIEAFRSPGMARKAYDINSSALACGYSRSTNISGEVSGLGEAGYAAELRYSSPPLKISETAYVGAILSGRYVLVLAVQTPLDNSFDQVAAFTLYADAAVHKVHALPGA